MSKFKIGFFWTLISLIITFIVLSFIFILPLLIFLLIFVFIGLYLFISGLEIIIKNNKTDRLGEICYGYVINIKYGNVTINNNTEIIVSFLTYIPSLKKVEIIDEKTGFDYYKVPIFSYAKLKYYNKDINFLETISLNDIPINVRNILFEEIEKRKEMISNEVINPTLNSLNSPDEMIINGIKYKKVDK